MTSVERQREGVVAPAKGRERPLAHPWLIAMGTYLAVAAATYWPMLPLASDRATNSGDDVAEQIWYLAWLPHAVLHGLNPFFSSDVNHPFGANIASNTSMPLLGLLASPFTMIFGPIAAYNLFLRIALVASAYSMYFVIRRFNISWPIAMVSGLFYGFSPYMIGQGFNHLYLIFVPIPPLMFWSLHQLVADDKWSVRRCGLVIGSLAGAEYLISGEIFADTALLTSLGLAVLAVRFRTVARQRSPRVIRALIWALLPIGVLVGYPAWYAVFGPQHFVTSPEPVEIAAFHSDLLGAVIPTVNQRFGPASWIKLGSSFAAGDYVENGVYLGIPLLLALASITWIGRRSGRVLFVALLGTIAYVLALGTPLVIDNHSTGVPLPFAVLAHLPLFQDEAAVRYSLFVDLFVALLIAFGLGELLRRTRARESVPTLRSKMSIGLAAVVAMFPLVPRVPYLTYSPGVPPYFTNGGVKAIAPGSVVLTYPSPVWPFTQPAIWQAISEMRFKIFGGSVAAPQDLTDVGEGTPALLEPKTLQEAFEVAAWGEPPSYIYGHDAEPIVAPPLNGATTSQIRSFLLIYGVQVVIIDPQVGAYPKLAVSYITNALGPPTSTGGGVDIWYDVQGFLRLHQ